MAKLELRIKEILDKQIKVDPDFDIEFERDANGKIKKVHTDKKDIIKLRKK